MDAGTWVRPLAVERVAVALLCGRTDRGEQRRQDGQVGHDPRVPGQCSPPAAAATADAGGSGNAETDLDAGHPDAGAVSGAGERRPGRHHHLSAADRHDDGLSTGNDDDLCNAVGVPQIGVYAAGVADRPAIAGYDDHRHDRADVGS